MIRYMLPIVLFVLVSCRDTCTRIRNTDDVQKKQTEKMVAEANRRLGLPNITKFTEKRFQKMIYELRDKEVRTFSYFMDMNGKLHFLCESIGYGMPAAVQYVNPQKFKRVDGGQYSEDKVIPQPEPNGLFMPGSLDATYVICVDKKGKLHPVYSEPKLIVSPFKLKHLGDMRK